MHVLFCILNGDKLAVMVFKREVYEHRRKPKGLFRPKQRATLKELQQVSIPLLNIGIIQFLFVKSILGVLSSFYIKCVLFPSYSFFIRDSVFLSVGSMASHAY